MPTRHRDRQLVTSGQPGTGGGEHLWDGHMRALGGERIKPVLTQRMVQQFKGALAVQARGRGDAAA